jgi:hypothetical protein
VEGLAATEDIAGVVDIVGIMVGAVDIMVAAISTGDPASTSADTLGPPTIIPTGIILPPIIIRFPITIRINRMRLPDLPPTPNRSKIPMGTIARLPKVTTAASQAVRVGRRGR